MKLKLNRTYTTIAVYALLVIAFALVLGVICLNIDVIIHGIGVFLSKLASLFFGIFFTFCFLPLVRFFERVFSKMVNRRKEHPVLLALLATIFVDILFVSLLAVVLINIVPAFVTAYNSFRSSVAPQIDAITERVDASASAIWAKLYHVVYDFFDNLLAPDSGSLITTVTTLVSTIVSKIYDIVVGLVLATYFLVCRRYLTTVSNKLFTAILPDKFRTATFAVVKRIYNFFVEFFSYRLISGFILALLSYLLCLPFHVPYRIIIAVLVFVANFVPVFGPVAATAVSTVLVAVFSTSDNRLWQALAVLIILASINILSNLLIEPFFLRKKLRPGPGTVVTCIIVFYAIFGFGGIIFAVPLYTSFDVAYREIQARLLARKNLPLNNAFYDKLEELPVPPKKKKAGDDERVTVEDVDAFTEHYGMTPEEAASGNYVILTDDTEENESATAVTETDVPAGDADSGDAAAESVQEFSESSPSADETPAPPKKRGLFGRKK